MPGRAWMPSWSTPRTSRRGSLGCRCGSRGGRGAAGQAGAARRAQPPPARGVGVRRFSGSVDKVRLAVAVSALHRRGGWQRAFGMGPTAVERTHRGTTRLCSLLRMEPGGAGCGGSSAAPPQAQALHTPCTGAPFPPSHNTSPPSAFLSPLFQPSSSCTRCAAGPRAHSAPPLSRLPPLPSSQFLIVPLLIPYATIPLSYLSAPPPPPCIALSYCFCPAPNPSNAAPCCPHPGVGVCDQDAVGGAAGCAAGGNQNLHLQLDHQVQHWWVEVGVVFV